MYLLSEFGVDVSDTELRNGSCDDLCVQYVPNLREIGTRATSRSNDREEWV